MKTQHTPTPWFVSRLASPDYAPQHGIYSESDTNDFAIIKGDNSEANARLIAAAPKLLAVLQYIEGRLPAHDTKAISQARAAIAEATA